MGLKMNRYLFWSVVFAALVLYGILAVANHFSDGEYLAAFASVFITALSALLAADEYAKWRDA